MQSMTRRIMTMDEYSSITKSEAPDVGASMNANRTRPTLNYVAPTVSTGIKMGYGVDPHEVVKEDWEKYKLFMSQDNY